MTQPTISKKANIFKRTASPVREIMKFANPKFVKDIGFESSEIISFAGGWVNHACPKELQDCYVEIVEDPELFHVSGGYPPTLGTFECREAIVAFEKHMYDINDLDPEQIVIGLGSTQLIYDLFQVLLDPDDKILLLDPSYCNYPSQIVTALDASILRFPVLDPESWQYVADQKIDEFSKYILETKPKVVLLVCPDNPTSQVHSDEFVQAALDAVKKIGSYLVIDFAYKEIVFSKQKPRYFSWGPNEHFITIHSNSKWSRSMGRRLGWIEATESIITAMESIQNSSILCPDMLHQMALTRYIHTAVKKNTLRPYIEEMSQKYHAAARHTIHSVEEHLGLLSLKPQGGLYTCVKLNTDGAKFVEDVLMNTGVLFVPGWGFGRTIQEGIRISYGPLVNDFEAITRGLERVGRHLNK